MFHQSRVLRPPGFKIVLRSLSELKPNPRNARTHSRRQIRQIADSIAAFGFNNPVLIDEEDFIIAGHGRVEAAKLLGMSEVPTVCLAHMSEEEKRAYVIADNKLAEKAGWDKEILAIEFETLFELAPELDVTVTGFEIAEIDLIIGDHDTAAEPDELDEVSLPYADAPVITRRGDLWRLGEHRVLCADATQEDSYVCLLQGEPAQMVFADPPYNVPISGHVSGLGHAQHTEFPMASGEMSDAAYTAFLTTILERIERHSSSGAIAFVCMDWRHLHELLVAGRASKLTHKNLCVWVKTNAGNALRNDLSAFVEKAFQTVCPGQTFWPNWHLQAICHALERVVAGEIKRLIVLVPPRSLKSICASVALPAWLLGRDPTRRIICVSYSADLAAKHARDCRAVMTTPWYQRVFPSTRLDPTKLAETEFMTTQRGFRLATSTGGTLTGRGGNIIIIDDPLKPADAHSDARRLDLQQWYTNTLLSRLDDKNTGAIVLVMQRLHIDDLAGYLMDQEGWEVLSLPAIADRKQGVPIGPRTVYYRWVGDLLHPERESLAVLEALKSEMGTYDFNAQYLQSPVPLGGNMIQWEWFPYYSDQPRRPEGSIIVQSWDTACTTGELASYSVGITAQIDKTGTIHVLDIVRGRWEFTDLQREMRKAAQCHQPKSILIEDQTSGTALQQNLKRDGYAVRPIKPKGDKVMRMRVHTPTLEAGKVLLKKNAPWLDELRAEVLAFPHGKHDDQVDALSQLMTWTEDWRIPKYGIYNMRW